MNSLQKIRGLMQKAAKNL